MSSKLESPRSDLAEKEQDGILLRHFEPQDEKAVKRLLAKGLYPLAHEMVRVSLRSFLFHTSVYSPSHPLYILVIPIFAMVWALREFSHWDAWTLVLLVTFMLSVLYAGLYVQCYFLFRQYVQYSLMSDMSNIPSVYQQHGGCFLVAVEVSTNQVIGMVGGEFKPNETSDGDKGMDRRGGDDVVYELRRMSVDRRIQRRGLGRRLIRLLERTLLQAGMTKLILTTSNLQYAGHALYDREGFQLQPKKHFPSANKAFWLMNYEKEYDTDMNKNNARVNSTK